METPSAETQTTPVPWALPAESRGQRWVWLVLFVAAVLALFAAYLRQAQTVRIGSDGASNALQAWDLLHGNVLLRAWTVSDVSFYTTELPQYALVELVRGLNSDVVHLAGAMSYTLIVLGGALLAKGSAGGREGAVRMIIAAGIMLAPSLGANTTILMSNPDHTGTQVPMLVIWLILDRARPRWWVSVPVAVLLAWVQVGDPIVLYEGVVPLVLVCAIRMYRRRGPLREQWYELSLSAGAIASAATASLAFRLIHQAGGFAVRPPAAAFTYIDTLYSNVWIALESVLLLFGADFSGQRLDASAAVALVHLAGVALAGWGVARALRRFADQELVVQVPAVTAVVLLAAYVTRGNPTVGGGAHEIAGVLPVGAVLAGRLLADQLIRGRHIAALAVMLACYAGFLAHNAVQQPRYDPARQAVAWLQANHLSYGLADYWNANAMTLDSGNRVQVRPIGRAGSGLVYQPWESENSWYDPAQHDASFIVLPGPASACSPGTVSGWQASARATFGPPSRTYRVAGFVVLVWHKNLLSLLSTEAQKQPAAC